MPQDAPSDRRSPFEAVVRLFAAVAVISLAAYAHRWALGGSLTDAEEAASLPIAAIVGLSAFLAWIPWPLMVRSACHLATLWIATQTLGAEWNRATEFGVFLAGTAAFFGAAATRVLTSFEENRSDRTSAARVQWSTGELLSSLFVLGAYAAIVRQSLATAGPETLQAVQIAFMHAGVPYLALSVAVPLFGRLGGSAAVWIAAVAASFVFPIVAPVDPIATVLIVALSALAVREPDRDRRDAGDGVASPC